MGWDASIYDDDFDDGDYEDDYYGKRPFRPTSPTCRECGADCVWVLTTKGWRLGDDKDTLHECDPEDRNALIDDCFDVVEDDTGGEG